MFLNRFENINLTGDIFGGVTTAIISLPLELAFGVAAGLMDTNISGVINILPFTFMPGTLVQSVSHVFRKKNNKIQQQTYIKNSHLVSEKLSLYHIKTPARIFPIVIFIRCLCYVNMNPCSAVMVMTAVPRSFYQTPKSLKIVSMNHTITKSQLMIDYRMIDY